MAPPHTREDNGNLWSFFLIRQLSERSRTVLSAKHMLEEFSCSWTLFQRYISHPQVDDIPHVWHVLASNHICSCYCCIETKIAPTDESHSPSATLYAKTFLSLFVCLLHHWDPFIEPCYPLPSKPGRSSDEGSSAIPSRCSQQTRSSPRFVP